jgi:hypothetical protein
VSLVSVKRQRVLDFDIENRPLAYLGADFTTGEITAIAASWVGSNTVKCWLLGRDDPKVMLEEFRELWDQADIATGHFILGHDLPVISGAMIEYNLAPLGQKMIQDTKVHLNVHKHLSASQENLAAVLGVKATKYHMTNALWREANRLTPKGIEITRTRVVADVIQHKEMREQLLKYGYITPPVMWGP